MEAGGLRYLLTQKGRSRLHSFCTERTLFAFDYDGTLAPITEHPKDSWMRRRTRALLLRLSRKGHVAVVSGRKLSDLRRRTPMRLLLVGNHGMEGMGPPKISSVRTCRRWAKALDRLRITGVFIENKRVSLSVHYRNAPHPELARKSILASCKTLHPKPRILTGKCIVNLLPQHSPNKGFATQQLAHRLGARRVVFTGDDKTDEDVFKLKRRWLFGISIGRRPGSQATFYLKSQREIEKLLLLCLTAVR